MRDSWPQRQLAFLFVSMFADLASRLNIRANIEVPRPSNNWQSGKFF
jgi:hypothetical protein